MQKVIIAIFLVITSLTVKAQFSVGFRGGYGNMGTYFEHPSLNNYQESHYKSNAGLVVIYNNDNNAGIQAEFNYAQKGWHEADTSVSGAFFTRDINYFELPVYSHWEIGYGKVRPIIFAGPYLAWKLSEKTTSENFTHIWFDDHPYNHYEQEIRDLDFGIKLGVGLRYNVNTRVAIFADVRIDLQVAGGRDIFIDHPNGIQASRLKETSGSVGVLWHIIPQKKQEIKGGYKPKEDLFEDF